MRTMCQRAFRVVSLVFVLAGVAACGNKPTAAAEPSAPPNTVLVEKDQLARMKVTTETVALQDIDDTVLASGKITYDDQRVAHVFSPVSGKVARVFVQLGSHVKKGDPLATIESPEIGAATSDVSKAKA